MTEISCTKKLAELLPYSVKCSAGKTLPAQHWYANLITLNRRKAVVALCVENSFGVVLWGLKKGDFERFSLIMQEGIQNALAGYGIKQSIIDQYIPADGELVLSAASDRKAIARMNRLVEDVKWHLDSLTTDMLLQMPIIKMLNQRIRRAEIQEFSLSMDERTNSGYSIPIEEMIRSLKRLYGEPPVSQTAFRLRASLDLERYMAVREFLVPANFSFSELHKILQQGFGFRDYHMHEFVIPSGERNLHIARVASDYLPENEVGIQEDGAILCKYLQAGSQCIYLYDFGDNWEIQIELLEVCQEYPNYYSVCTICEGAAPPEDVGGVNGFLDFLDIVSDTSHPEYENMKKWAGYGWKEQPDCSFINQILK